MSVGGARLSRIDSAEKIASTAPAAPSRWPVADLVDDIDDFPGGIAEQPLDRGKLDLVAHRRRGAMGIDVIDVGWLDAGALDRRGHAAIGAVAILGGRSDVESIA